MTISAVRLNHAVLFVSDLERSLEFYSQAFGTEVVAREPRANAAFLRMPGSQNHHDLGLFGLGAEAPPRAQGTVGLYHLAWQGDTIEALDEACTVLRDLGAYTGQSSHGATKSVYGVDPDGNEFEVMWMLPREAWGEFENAAPIDRLDLAGEISRWGGTRTLGRITTPARPGRPGYVSPHDDAILRARPRPPRAPAVGPPVRRRCHPAGGGRVGRA